ncbi:MAG: HK97 family phage prohead protease [Butyrivibrio sp.]|nr:HK97 family phage prohead protease [Butyrivibrio sp.]
MKVTIRADTVEIEGYVNAVGRDSRTLTDEYGYPFVEQMSPGVFSRALSQAEKNEKVINMLLDHDENHVIGSTAEGLELEED